MNDAKKAAQPLMTTNCLIPAGKTVIAGACLEQMEPEAYAEITKDADCVLTLCLEESHINMAVTKIAAILGMGRVTEIVLASVDHSPHCTQMHYIRREIERTMPEHVPMRDYIAAGGVLTEIGEAAVAASKSLAALQRLAQTAGGAFAEAGIAPGED